MTQLNTIKYCDGLETANRVPRLFFVKEGHPVQKFEGKDIPGICVITASRYSQNGKWSNTKYEISYGQETRAFPMLSPMHGVWGESFTSWEHAAEVLKLSVERTQELVRRAYKVTGERLDGLADKLAAL